MNTSSRSSAPAETGSWYLLQCRAHQELRAQENLVNQDFHCYCPQLPVKRRRNRRVFTQDEALFPGYLFVRLRRNSNWTALHSTRGVRNLVRFNGEPAKVAEAVVETIHQRCCAVLAPQPLFHAGQRVRISEGAFRDIEAMVQTVRGDERVVLLLNFMQRQQRVVLEATQLLAV